jgi:hypothetical protein
MKSLLAQLVIHINKIDRRHIQLAYFAFMLAGFLFTQKPSDGGVGPV